MPMLAPSVVIHGGGNRSTQGKPLIFDGRHLPSHMSTPGFDHGWQASVLPTALSRRRNGIIGCEILVRWKLKTTFDSEFLFYVKTE